MPSPLIFDFLLPFPLLFPLHLPFGLDVMFPLPFPWALPGIRRFLTARICFLLIKRCVLDGCDGILGFHVISTWSRGRNNLLHINGNVFFTKSCGADVLSATLFLISPIHVLIFAILSRLSTISFTKWRSSDKHSTCSRVYPLSGLPPLMSMSSEPANPSMDVRMNALYELFAQFLNDDSCAWAQFFGTS